MSAIEKLFGKTDSQNIESTVNALFANTNPIDQTLLKSKQRTKLDTENSNLESDYFAKLADSNDETPQDEQPSNPVVAATTVDLKDNELEKADRSVFIGNVPVSVITSKDTYKQFKKLFTREDTTIESIRFRSISFDESLPRKVAFVQQKLHQSRDSVNAYIVYKNKNAVKPICNELNAVIFQNHHLRVDSVSHPAPHDNKRSVFVGNLDFEGDEENLWSHFKKCGEIEYVRIIRDTKTNLGKGFAYVQFKDLQSINKALLLNEKPMHSENQKPNKKPRKLRVTRCKNIKKLPTRNNNSSQKNFNDSQKTKIGRAKRILGKADRSTVAQKITIEGQRASKGEGVSHLNKKKARSKTGRVTKRSIAFKKAQSSKD